MGQKLFILIFTSLLGYATATAQGSRGGWMEYRYLYDAPNLYNPEVIEWYYVVKIHSLNTKRNDILHIFDALTGEAIINRSIQPYDSTPTSRFITHFFNCQVTKSSNDTCDDYVYLLPVTVRANSNGHLFSMSFAGRDIKNVNIDNPRYSGLLNTIIAPGGNTLNNYNIKNPLALPTADHTTYSVVASLNACRAYGAITIHASPYPKVKTSPDTVICVGNSIGISGMVQAAFYNWSPVNTLTNSTTLNPVATPETTTAYILSVRDTFYCPKTVRDTTVVRVIQKFKADAGRDTSVVIGQPLQLNASSPGTTYVLQYTWQPPTYLNNAAIQNPVAIFSAGVPDVVRYTIKATTREGCSVTDDIAIKVYKTGPDILVPSAFTPNGDGKNDVLRPLLPGIRKLDFFTVYNRWGQPVFTTSEAGRGWDGTTAGMQQTETFVYLAQATDYTGRKIYKKGTVLLLR